MIQTNARFFLIRAPLPPSVLISLCSFSGIDNRSIERWWRTCSDKSDECTIESETHHLVVFWTLHCEFLFINYNSSSYDKKENNWSSFPLQFNFTSVHTYDAGSNKRTNDNVMAFHFNLWCWGEGENSWAVEIAYCFHIKTQSQSQNRSHLSFEHRVAFHPHTLSFIPHHPLLLGPPPRVASPEKIHDNFFLSFSILPLKLPVCTTTITT